MKRRSNDRVTKWGLRRRIVELEQENAGLLDRIRNQRRESDNLQATYVSLQTAYKVLLTEARAREARCECK